MFFAKCWLHLFIFGWSVIPWTKMQLKNKQYSFFFGRNKSSDLLSRNAIIDFNFWLAYFWRIEFIFQKDAWNVFLLFFRGDAEDKGSWHVNLFLLFAQKTTLNSFIRGTWWAYRLFWRSVQIMHLRSWLGFIRGDILGLRDFTQKTCVAKKIFKKKSTVEFSRKNSETFFGQ